MPHRIGAAARAAAAAGLLCWSATIATAQTAPAGRFLPKSAFDFSWAALASGDPRFSWDADLGIDLDVVDYAIGRLTFVADYEAVLGSERRAFDLNHGNYTLESAASVRHRGAEYSAAFHHVSRHLSDRESPNIVAWNVLDLRAARQVAVARSTLDAQLAWGRVLQRNFADYAWTADLRLTLRRPVGTRSGLFASAWGGLVGVDPTKAGRERLCGSRLEAGWRLNGRAAALELFAGYERRIDAYPLERRRARWFAFGFRFVGR